LISSIFYPGGHLSYFRAGVAVATVSFVVYWFFNRQENAARVHRATKAISSTNVVVKNVSPNNPCPFLRSLVSHGLLHDDVESISYLSLLATTVASKGDGHPDVTLLSFAAYPIAMVANGWTPGPMLSALTGHGVQINRLRQGPLYKNGSGSRIIDEKGNFVEAEFKRMEGFGSPKTAADGSQEAGIDIGELAKFMDANFERNAAKRRSIDRSLADGEWPVLLKVVGKDGKNGKRYLAFTDLRNLIAERRLPQRMIDRIAKAD